MITEAIILAGGFGTRLRTLVSDVPKPMAPIGEKPFLHYLFLQLKKHGFTSVVLSIGYKHEIIQNYFGETYLGIKVKYAIETTPLGTGGAIHLALQKIEGQHVFVLNGDTYLEVDFHRMALRKQNCLIATKELTNFDRYGTLEVAENGKVNQFIEKKTCKKGLINGGIYLLDKAIFDTIKNTAFSFEEEMLTPLSQKGEVYSIPANGYFKDIGIPEDYLQFKEDVMSNKLKF